MEPNNRTWYINSISLKVDLSLNTKQRLYQKSNKNHSHCKCLRNTDHFRDGLVCAFDLFALSLSLFFFFFFEFFTFEEEVTFYHWKSLKKYCFIHWSFLPSQIIWHCPCIRVSIFALVPGWLWLNPISFFMLLSVLCIYLLLMSRSEYPINYH